MSAKLGEPTLINGVAYTHSDWKILFQGIPILEVTSFDYAEPQNIEGNHGTGSKQTSVGYGTLKPEAKMTMSMTEYRRLVAGAPNRKIQNYPLFDLIVHCSNREKGFFTDRLLACKWKGPAVGSQVDNKMTEVTIMIFVGDIKWG